jgi:hypothetical protein
MKTAPLLQTQKPPRLPSAAFAVALDLRGDDASTAGGCSAHDPRLGRTSALLDGGGTVRCLGATMPDMEISHRPTMPIKQHC